MSKQEAQKPRGNRRVVLITGGVMLFFSLYLLVFLVPDYLRSVLGPESMTLERAAEVASDESLYVSFEDGEWDCDTIDYVRGVSGSNRTVVTTRSTEIFLTDAENPQQIVVLASLSGEMTCEEIEAGEKTGYLTRMADSEKRELTNDARLARYFDATEFMTLCGYCGEENSLIGLVFGVIFAVAGVGVIILGLRMPKLDSAVQEEPVKL